MLINGLHRSLWRAAAAVGMAAHASHHGVVPGMAHAAGTAAAGGNGAQPFGGIAPARGGTLWALTGSINNNNNNNKLPHRRQTADCRAIFQFRCRCSMLLFVP